MKEGYTIEQWLAVIAVIGMILSPVISWAAMLYGQVAGEEVARSHHRIEKLKEEEDP